MRNVIILLAVLALVAGIGLFFFGDENSDPAPLNLNGSPAHQTVPPDSSAPENPDAHPEPGGESPSVIATRAFSPPKEKIVVVEGRRVKVIVAATRAPVPMAVVGFLDADAVGPGALLGGDTGFLDIEGNVDRFGAKFQADDLGVAVVPITSGSALICAQTETHFGLSKVRPDSANTIILALKPIERGTIQVLDAAGSPVAGVPVAIRLDTGGVTSFVLWRGQTRGPKGLVHVRNLDSALRMIGSEGGPFWNQPLCVTTGFPLTTPPEYRLEKRKFPADPIQLRLPDTGRVVIKVTEPSDRQVKVNLHSGTSAMLGMRGFEGAFNVGFSKRLTKKGTAVFEFVGLGLTLDVEAIDPDGILEATRLTLDGPTGSGQVVEFEMALASRAVALTGRIVDAEGAPAANRDLMVLESPISGFRLQFAGFEPIKTREDGTFRLSVNAPDASKPVSGPFRVSTRKNRFSVSNEIEQQGSITIRGPFPPGDTDVGEIVIRELPVVAAGTVVDSKEQPLSRAIVKGSQVVEADHDESGVSPAKILDVASAVTDADGNFEIRSTQESGKLELSWSRAGYCALGGRTMGSRVVPVGDRNIVLKLSQAGGLTGSVLLDPDMPHDCVRIEVRGSSLKAALREDRSFKLENLKPGPVSLDVIAQVGSSGATVNVDSVEYGEEERADVQEKRGLLLTITDVHVIAGKMSSHPRILDIDLRGRLSRFAVRIVDEGGEPIRDATVKVKGINLGAQLLTDKEGRTRIISPDAALVIKVAKTGYEPAETALSPGENQIALKRGYEVRLTLSRGLKTPGSTYWLIPTLTSLEEKTLTYRPNFQLGTNDSPTFTSSWKALLAPNKPGRYTLKLILVGGFGNAGNIVRETIENFEPQIVEITPGQHLTLVQIKINPTALEKAVQAAK